MRLFQHHNVHSPFDASTPAPPPLPPFLTDQEEERSLCLLRESTTHLREGRQRLATPDKVAIMELSSSFDKKRLGKQQQILSEITQRCREQEVTDLSSKITAKVFLRQTGREERDCAAMHLSTKMSQGMVRNQSPDYIYSPGGGLTRQMESVEKRLKFEKGYKFFPARKIIRDPTRVPLGQSPTGMKDGWGGGGGGGSHQQRDTVTRMNTDHAECNPRANTVDRPVPKGPLGAIQNYLHPKLDTVPPLLLAHLHGDPSSNQEGQGSGNDRVGYCYSSSRMPVSHRSRTYFQASRNSSRGLSRTLPVDGNRPAWNRHHLKATRVVDRGLHSILQDIFSDMQVGSSVKQQDSQRDVPIDLKTAPLLPRRLTQKV